MTRLDREDDLLDLARLMLIVEQKTTINPFVRSLLLISLHGSSPCQAQSPILELVSVFPS